MWEQAPPRHRDPEHLTIDGQIIERQVGFRISEEIQGDVTLGAQCFEGLADS